MINKSKDIVILVVLASLIGIITGTIDFVFGSVLLKITSFREEYFYYLIPFLPFAGLLTLFLYDRFGKNSYKGMTLIFDYIKGNEKNIPIILIPLILFSTWITHIFGGSAGREGVAVQIGADIGSKAGFFLKKEDMKKILVVSGMAAGFAGLFETPIAAIFFALEVVFYGSLLYKALIPTTIASFFSYLVSSFLGLPKFNVFINVDLNINFIIFLKLIFIGAIFGFTGFLFSTLLSFLKKYMPNFIKNKYIRIFIVSFILVFIFIALYGGRYSGLGTNLISSGFNGDKIYYYDFLFKIILTCITISIGFQGGEVTPLFAIGVALGNIIAPIIGIPSGLCMALGYACVFGGASNTLIAPIFIGAEVFGFENIQYFVIACISANIFNFNKSIYSQKLVSMI